MSRKPMHNLTVVSSNLAQDGMFYDIREVILTFNKLLGHYHRLLAHCRLEYGAIIYVYILFDVYIVYSYYYVYTADRQ